MRQALMRLKFGGVRVVAEELAAWMVTVVPEILLQASPAITWVPLGPRRKRERGFDQAEVLARAVGALTRWPVRAMLRRVTETLPQAQRTGSERRRALRGAFQEVARPPPLVVLIDDVLTSGATAAECARALRRSGAHEVSVLTAARSLGGAVPARCYNPAGLQPGSVVDRGIVSRKSMPVAGETTHVR